MTNQYAADCQSNGRVSSVLLLSRCATLVDSIRSVLSGHYFVEDCTSNTVALQLTEKQSPDCLLVEMQCPGDETLALLRSLKKCAKNLPVVLICSAAEISTALEGIRAGAQDFVIKEVEIANLAERIAKVTGRSAKTLQTMAGNCPRQSCCAPGRMIVGRSPRMLEVMEIARRAASYPVTILLLGENGTGKGLFAHWIHRMSRRAEGPFVAVNLAAIPSELVESTLFGHERGAFTGAVEQRVGKFAQAQNGTLLLDEISELKLELQPKLLRVLQEGEFERVGGERTLLNEARTIAATNQDICELVQQGAFRADLFYRLNVVTITLPPLRDRREDIPDLVRLFLAKYNRLYERSLRGIEPEAMDCLMDHSWPGNIRELEHSIQRALIVSAGDCVGVGDLFDAESSGKERLVNRLADRLGTLEELEQQYIKEILRRTEGHQGQAARILGIDRKTLYNKIMKYGLRQSLDQNSEQESEIGKFSPAGGKMPKRTAQSM